MWAARKAVQTADRTGDQWAERWAGEKVERRAAYWVGLLAVATVVWMVDMRVDW